MHSLVNSYKKVLAVAVETEISWPEIEQLKDRIANPDAYAAAAPAASSGGAAAATEAAPAEEKKDEEEEEDEEGFGGLLYVIPLKYRLELTLTYSIATKQPITVLDRFSGLLRLVSRYMDLNLWVHRSLVGQNRINAMIT
jgi:large subunit ribosomal protein LP0